MKFITMFTLGAAFCILVVSFFGHTLYQDEKRFDKFDDEYYALKNITSEMEAYLKTIKK